MAPPKTNANKFDPSEHFRTEIEERTAQGETCEQIASALRSKGVDITNKTISRRRVEWGLRKRQYNKMLGQKVTKQRTRKLHTKKARTSLRKAEIEAGTQRGETAEQIAAALEAQGHVLKSGVSTVLRLQTTWGLIPPDEDRARGRRKKGEGQSGATSAKVTTKPKVSKRAQVRWANEQQRNYTQHYPTNCSFGPRKRVNGVAMTEGDGQDGDATSQSLLLPSPFDDYPPPTSNANQTGPSSVTVAAELMSVEFLVDLATSTLTSATNLKELLMAYQAGQPAVSSSSGLPPTLEELSTARRKVREAAAVMHDLAVDPIENAPG